MTIDGETARDFDDAVHVSALPNGNYELQVHIADVAHYVPRDSPLDREARLRGTSVYFPNRAVPMLPEELSNGICSLNPNVDRLVMSAVMEMDATGNTFARNLLRRDSLGRADDVHQRQQGARRRSGNAERYASLAAEFRRMKELALLLNKQRHARGSIDFDLPEPVIEFDESGRMLSILRSERNIAHRLIEEFMLAANEAVAQYLEKRGICFASPRPRKTGPQESDRIRGIGPRVRLHAGRGRLGRAPHRRASWPRGRAARARREARPDARR